MRTVLKFYVRVVMFLLPLFWLPVIYDSFALGKVIFLVATGLIGLLIWLVDFLVNKREVIKSNKFFWWLLVLMAWSVVSFVKLDVGVKMSSLMSITGFGVTAGLFIWSFLWLQVSDKDEYKKQFSWLVASGMIVAVASLISFVIPTSKLPLYWPKDNPILSITSGWSITGSVFGEVVFMLFLVMESLKRMLAKLKKKADINDYLKEAIGVVFFALVLFVGVYKIAKIGWVFLDNKSSWVVATESLKNSPIFGVGVGNYGEAFRIFRPVSFNSTKYWSSALSLASMEWLQLWTELGVVALIWLVLMVMTWLSKRKEKYFWQVGLLGTLFLFLPFNYLTAWLLVWLLSSKFFETKELKMILRVGEKNFNVMPYLFGLLVLAVVGTGGYFYTRILIGDYYWKQSLVAASKNDGLKTYQLQIKAIDMNPAMANYRSIYAQTNLALAQNFLSKEEKDLTEDDKQKASTLVQQAVREAKAAVSLDQRNSNYWTVLGSIYRNLAGMVDGAADWSVQAFQQAIILDPANPLIKIELGGIYYASESYDMANRAFEDAVTTKTDYPNAWYNWAYTAKKMNQLQVAVNRLEKAVSLVSPDSGDYEKASEELATWKKELEEMIKKQKEEAEKQNGQQKEAETLKTPDPIPTVDEENKVAVPTGDMAPPTSEVTPTPEAVPTAVVSPTPGL